MNADRAYQFKDKLQQLVRSIQALREAGTDIEGLSKRLRAAEFELLYGIDAIKIKEESERVEKVEKPETPCLPRHRQRR